MAITTASRTGSNHSGDTCCAQPSAKAGSTGMQTHFVPTSRLKSYDIVSDRDEVMGQVERIIVEYMLGAGRLYAGKRKTAPRRSVGSRPPGNHDMATGKEQVQTGRSARNTGKSPANIKIRPGRINSWSNSRKKTTQSGSKIFMTITISLHSGLWWSSSIKPENMKNG